MKRESKGDLEGVFFIARLIHKKTDKLERQLFFNKYKTMNSKKLLNYAELSECITGNRNTIRSNRENKKHCGAVNELIDYLDLWIFRNSKSKETTVTIKTK